MIRATTPTILARIRGVDLNAANAVYVTIKQYGQEISLTGEDLDIRTVTEEEETRTEIFFHLSQLTSLSLREGKAEIQVNWLYVQDGEVLRGATKFTHFPIDKQILARVLP